MLLLWWWCVCLRVYEALRRCLYVPISSLVWAVCGWVQERVSDREIDLRLSTLAVPLIDYTMVSFWDFGSSLANLVYETEALKKGQSFSPPEQVLSIPCSEPFAACLCRVL